MQITNFKFKCTACNYTFKCQRLPVKELIEAQKAREQEEDKENIKDKKSRKFGFFVSFFLQK